MRNNASRKNLKYCTWRMTCPKVTLSAANPTWTGLGLNLGLCGKRLETNQLSDGMDVDLSGTSIMGIKSNVFSIEICLH